MNVNICNIIKKKDKASVHAREKFKAASQDRIKRIVPLFAHLVYVILLDPFYFESVIYS